MAVDPKKNLEDIGFMIYELKNIYALTDDAKIDITLPDPFTTIEEIASDSSTATEPEYKRLKDYDGNIKTWLDKIIDLTQTHSPVPYKEIDDANNEFFENASQNEKDELDSIFSGNLDFNNPTNEELQSIAFRVYEAYQLLKELYDT